MEKVGERMADISTEELERIEREYHSGSDNIKPIQEFSKPEDLYDELIASIRKYHPSTDITLIEKAYHVAFEVSGSRKHLYPPDSKIPVSEEVPQKPHSFDPSGH